MGTQHSLKHQQQGAVLVVSLLVLLVLTLIGISSMNGSIMEEKMAANAQIATTTFQKAESSIRETFYRQSRNPALAVANARDGDTVTYNDSTHSIESRTQMLYPVTTVKTPIYNNSAGFIAHGIEIVGMANVDNIQNRNVQGYRIFPMMPEP
jgi:Tfp pilus assembly protein PilX